MNLQNQTKEYHTHTQYGNIEYNIWKPVYAHRTCRKTNNSEIIKQPNYEIMFINNKESPFIIRNIKTKNYVNCCRERYILCNNKINITFLQHHIALSSAFPTITPKYTIDHINDDHTDNRVTNLMWMERSDNSRKGQLKAVKNSNENGGRKGRYVTMRKPCCNDKKNRDKSLAIGLFRSIDKCASFIIDNVIQKDSKPTIKTVSAKIRRAINIPEYTAYGYYYDNFEIEIENEEWKRHPIYSEYEISTHGRFKNKHGNIVEQQKCRNGAKYNSVMVNTSYKYIHRLVWETWCGDIPENMDIMHDDEAPLCEDGSYRNWLCDLSIGTRRENMISYHNNKLNPVDTINDNKIIENIPEINSILYERIYPNNELGDLMRNTVGGIQYIKKTKQRGSKYVLSRHYSKTKHDICTNGKTKITDEEKFIDIIKIYQENCIEEKQDKKIMELDIKGLKQYIPK